MINLILTLAVIGFALWLLITYVPMVEPIKKLIIVIVAVCVLLYLLSAFGIADVPLPRVHR